MAQANNDGSIDVKRRRYFGQLRSSRYEQRDTFETDGVRLSCSFTDRHMPEQPSEPKLKDVNTVAGVKTFKSISGFDSGEKYPATEFNMSLNKVQRNVPMQISGK